MLFQTFKSPPGARPFICSIESHAAYTCSRPEDGGDVCIKTAKGLKDSASHGQSSVPGLAEAE